MSTHPGTDYCSANTNSGSDRRILLVDDDPDMAVVLQERLTVLGYDSMHVLDGETALVCVPLWRPHLVLLDIRLPGIDGLEVSSRISDHPATCDTPVIIISGMERPDIVRQSRAAGAWFFLRKPYDPNTLLVLIEQTLAEVR